MTVSISRVFRVFVAAAVAPAALYAQSIACVVRDGSNAVLPGVTVKAASPALIEKVRVAVSDSTGQYRIENLRPGVYTMTFSLTGFRTVRRDGLELTGSIVDRATHWGDRGIVVRRELPPCVTQVYRCEPLTLGRQGAVVSWPVAWHPVRWMRSRRRRRRAETWEWRPRGQREPINPSPVVDSAIAAATVAR